MGLKSANLERSAAQVREGKAAVLEENSSELPQTAGRGRRDKKSQPRRSSGRPAALSAADDVEALYVEHRTLLQFIACRKFHIAESDSENLIQDVFLSYLQTGTKIDNVRAWLVAAMCNASRHYWRAQSRTESLPDDFNEHSDPLTHGLADDFARKMTLQQAISYLPPKCQETLRLHYFEGRSASDVARELETTPRYAEKLIHNCLKRVRDIYMNITAVKK
jgi:RNA polymerase sigma factor (sigma-70 family)